MASDCAAFKLVDFTLASSETTRLNASLDKIKAAEIVLQKSQSCAASAGQSEQLEHIRAQIQSISSLIRMRLQLCAHESPTDDYGCEAILADSKLAEIVAEAKRAQAAVLSLLHDPEQHRALN